MFSIFKRKYKFEIGDFVTTDDGYTFLITGHHHPNYMVRLVNDPCNDGFIFSIMPIFFLDKFSVDVQYTRNSIFESELNEILKG